MRNGFTFGFLVVLLTFMAPAFALVTPSPFKCHSTGGCFEITGFISEKDFDDMKIIADRQAARLKTEGRLEAPYIVLDSEGGDIEAALGMGRLLRRLSATVVIGSRAKCFSACVYLLAGATRRNVWGRVGIHRPYSQSTDVRDYDTIQKEQRRIAVSSKTYLDEMNLPTSLYDAMVRTPPENIRVLSEEQLAEFGLAQTDPVAQEMSDTYGARKYGLSKMEFLGRKAMVDIQCAQHWSLAEMSADNEVAGHMNDYVLCEERVMQPNPFDEFDEEPGQAVRPELSRPAPTGPRASQAPDDIDRFLDEELRARGRAP